MDIIDVSPDDLVLPGDCLGGAVRGECPDGSTEVVLRRLWDVHPDDLAPSLRRLRQEWLDYCKRDVHNCRRPEVRDRLRRVLAAGERCPGCVECVNPGFDPEKWKSRCAGTGYTRQPHDLGSFIDAEIAGRITPLVAAGLWWASALRVEAGQGPVAATASRCPWETDRDENCIRGLMARNYAVEAGPVKKPDHWYLPLPGRIARLRLTDNSAPGGREEG